MASAHYNRMVQDLDIAREIAKSLPANACNTTLQELKLKSYIFMSHAVIEEYLEAICLDIATQAISQFSESSTITTALVGLISSGIVGRIEEDGISKKLRREPFEDIELFASTAFGRYKSIIGGNNGIKKEDQFKLLIPIGVDPEVEDPATMAALDSYGGKRGAIAHEFKISRSHTLSEIDTELKTIKSGLANYDAACLARI